MAFHQFQPWRYQLGMQPVPFGQFNACQILQSIQYRSQLNLTAGDLIIASIRRWQNKAVGFNGAPEFPVVHRFKPIINVIYGFELFHIFKNTRFGIPGATIFEKGDWA